jgi:maltose alpha-D-glucosyltransferase/alpha-amylase
MRYDWRGNSLVTVHNFDTRPHELSIRVGVDGGERLVSLLAEEESAADEKGIHRLVIDAFGYDWYRVGGLNYALRRERE